MAVFIDSVLILLIFGVVVFFIERRLMKIETMLKENHQNSDEKGSTGN